MTHVPATPGHPHACQAYPGRTDPRLSRILLTFAEERGLGEIFINTGFILRRDPDLVRGPDQAFVSTETMAMNPPPERGFWPAVPELVVEIF